MPMTTKCLASQYLIAEVNLHEYVTHKAHVNNLPFNSISNYIPKTKHTVTPITSTATTRWNSMIIYANHVDPPAETPSPQPRSPSSAWKNWVIGILMTFAVPSVTTKGGPIKLMMQKVDHIVDTAEHITDVVEAVAYKVDKVIEETEGNLPEGSQIRKTLDNIEDVAERIQKHANAAGDLIDMVQEMQDKIEDILELEEAMEVAKEANEKEKSKRENKVKIKRR